MASESNVLKLAGKGNQRWNLSRQEILSEFEKMRQQQRRLYAELADQELELQEHGEVIKILKAVNPSQKCCYFTSGILAEMTAEEVFSFVAKAKDKVEDRISKLNNGIQSKARQVNDFQRIYNIQMKKPE